MQWLGHGLIQQLFWVPGLAIHSGQSRDLVPLQKLWVAQGRLVGPMILNIVVEGTGLVLELCQLDLGILGQVEGEPVVPGIAHGPQLDQPTLLQAPEEKSQSKLRIFEKNYPCLCRPWLASEGCNCNILTLLRCYIKKSKQGQFIIASTLLFECLNLTKMLS